MKKRWTISLNLAGLANPKTNQLLSGEKSSGVREIIFQLPFFIFRMTSGTAIDIVRPIVF